MDQTLAADIALNWSKLGILERAGDADHPFIQTCLWRVGMGLDAHDEISWCAGFVALVLETLGIAPSTPIRPTDAARLALPRIPMRTIGKAAARSYLPWGLAVPRGQYRRGDVCVFKRGTGNQPGKDVLDAQGHVAFFLEEVSGTQDGARITGPSVRVVGGNQKNQITVADFPIAQLLDVRRAE